MSTKNRTHVNNNNPATTTTRNNQMIEQKWLNKLTSLLAKRVSAWVIAWVIVGD